MYLEHLVKAPQLSQALEDRQLALSSRVCSTDEFFDARKVPENLLPAWCLPEPAEMIEIGVVINNTTAY